LRHFSRRRLAACGLPVFDPSSPSFSPARSSCRRRRRSRKGRKGDEAKGQLAAAESLFAAGKYVEARTQATRAKEKFKEGSPGWLKADDILAWRPPGASE